MQLFPSVHHLGPPPPAPYHSRPSPILHFPRSLRHNSQLLLLPHVLFAGYKVPHPLEPRFIIKIQTDSESTPIQAVQEACRGLIQTLSKMREQLEKEFTGARAMGGATDVLPGFPGTQGPAIGGGDDPLNEGLYGAAAGGPSGYDEFLPQ